MDRRLILDTNALIAFERREFDLARLDDDDVVIAALTVAEYRVGIELADSEERAAARSRALERICSVIDVLSYTTATAEHHARLLAHVKRSGRPRGAHDLIIATHALAERRIVVSRDAHARFGDLPGVEALSLDAL